DFEKICERTGIRQLNAEILDLRREAWRTENGVIVERHKLPEDPRGYTLVNLGDQSCFTGKNGNFYGADYDTAFTATHHSNGRHVCAVVGPGRQASWLENLRRLWHSSPQWQLVWQRYDMAHGAGLESGIFPKAPPVSIDRRRHHRR